MKIIPTWPSACLPRFLETALFFIIYISVCVYVCVRVYIYIYICESEREREFSCAYVCAVIGILNHLSDRLDVLPRPQSPICPTFLPMAGNKFAFFQIFCPIQWVS